MFDPKALKAKYFVQPIPLSRAPRSITDAGYIWLPVQEQFGVRGRIFPNFGAPSRGDFHVFGCPVDVMQLCWWQPPYRFRIIYEGSVDAYRCWYVYDGDLKEAFKCLEGKRIPDMSEHPEVRWDALVHNTSWGIPLPTDIDPCEYQVSVGARKIPICVALSSHGAKLVNVRILAGKLELTQEERDQFTIIRLLDYVEEYLSTKKEDKCLIQER